jgi:hypothetical protein
MSEDAPDEGRSAPEPALGMHAANPAAFLAGEWWWRRPRPARRGKALAGLFLVS